MITRTPGNLSVDTPNDNGLQFRHWYGIMRTINNNRRFVQRVSILAWTVAATVAISLFLRLPTVVLPFNVIGSPMTIIISETTMMAGFIALLTASGTERAIRTHPYFSRYEPSDEGRTWLFWALPAAVSILAVLLTPLATTPLLQAAAVLFSSGLISIILFNLYTTVVRGAPGYQRARIFLNILTYASVLSLFLLVYQTRVRSLLSGSLVAVTAGLLAVELLRDATSKIDLVLSYAAMIGIILGEVTWALNYWLLPGASSGLFLLLIFYLFVGLARHGLLEGRLIRRVMLEYTAVSILALALIALVGPGF